MTLAKDQQAVRPIRFNRLSERLGPKSGFTVLAKPVAAS
jgi:hypothetical protein